MQVVRWDTDKTRGAEYLHLLQHSQQEWLTHRYFAAMLKGCRRNARVRWLFDDMLCECCLQKSADGGRQKIALGSETMAKIHMQLPYTPVPMLPILVQSLQSNLVEQKKEKKHFSSTHSNVQRQKHIHCKWYNPIRVVSCHCALSNIIVIIVRYLQRRCLMFNCTVSHWSVVYMPDTGHIPVLLPFNQWHSVGKIVYRD